MSDRSSLLQKVGQRGNLTPRPLLSVLSYAELCLDRKGALRHGIVHGELEIMPLCMTINPELAEGEC
jgi:hypothetical protein